MLTLPIGKRGRLLALGLTLAVSGGLWTGIIQPVLAWYTQGAELLRQRQVLARRMVAIVQELPALQRQADTAAAQGRQIGMLLSGATDALAGAALQGRLEGMVRDSGVRLGSTETLPAQPTGAYRRIPLRLSVTGNWSELVVLLRAIDHSTPPLFIDDVQLYGTAIRGRTDLPPIEAAFTVFGFRAGHEQAVGQPAARRAIP